MPPPDRYKERGLFRNISILTHRDEEILDMDRCKSGFKVGQGPVLLLAVVLGLVLALGLAPVVQAQMTWTVDASLPNNDNCNTTSLQCQTIQAAVDAATAGDTINVAAGTYVEAVTLPASRGNLTIQGADSATTVLNGGIRTRNNSGITIRNVSIIDGNDWSDDGNDNPAIWLEGGTSAHVLEGLILDGLNSGGRGVLIGYDVTDVQFTDVSVSNWTTGVYVNPRSSLAFEGYNAGGGGSISVDGPIGLTVQNSIFVDSGIGLSDYDASGTPNGIVIQNTNFSGNSIALSLWDAQTDGWASGTITLADADIQSEVPLRLRQGAAWPPSEVPALSGLIIDAQRNTISVTPNSFYANSITPV
ncbi:MAG: hypothetical protein KDD84_21135, partial [Caldilineaceae bacterium]|nr:hypothetical protein [Caldilineaceae bacterium]